MVYDGLTMKHLKRIWKHIDILTSILVSQQTSWHMLASQIMAVLSIPSIESAGLLGLFGSGLFFSAIFLPWWDVGSSEVRPEA